MTPFSHDLSEKEYWSDGALTLLVLYPDVFRDGDAASMVAIVVESFASFRGHHRMESRSVRAVVACSLMEVLRVFSSNFALVSTSSEKNFA